MRSAERAVSRRGRFPTAAMTTNASVSTSLPPGKHPAGHNYGAGQSQSANGIQPGLVGKHNNTDTTVSATHVTQGKLINKNFKNC